MPPSIGSRPGYRQGWLKRQGELGKYILTAGGDVIGATITLHSPYGFDIVIVVSVSIQFTASDQTQMRALGVSALYLFGSHAEGAASERSDVDIGVLLHDPRVLSGDTMPLYLALFALIGRYVPNSDRLDIVFLQRTPLELRYDVVTHGVPLFQIDEGARLDFEERTVIAYCDFRPLLRRFDRAIIEDV